MPQQLLFEVKIRRRKRSLPEASFDWDVAVYKRNGKNDKWNDPVERRVYDLNGSGRAYTLKRAKKKALRHIMSIDKNAQKGLEYGVIVTIEKTNAQEAIKALSE